MTTVERSIEVGCPIGTVYNQWTQFEDFPRFMEGVEQVSQLDDKRVHWVAEIAGQRREWDARITEQRPEERIAWASEGGENTAGVVTFHKLDEHRTKVMLQMEFKPDGIVEQVGDKLGIVGHRVQGDLERFKNYIEARGAETGGWRGTIDRE
jgi:uncharacterized membrane protein